MITGLSRPASDRSYRVPPPAPGSAVAWPDDFGQRFTVFVDTEEEFDWTRPLAREGWGTEAAAAIPEAHARFAGHGVPLTFLVDHPIVADPRAVEAIRPLIDGATTVGTQLHAWVNPPFEEPLTPADSYAGNLPLELEAAKLDVLTAAIRKAFGVRPRVYRAGRYGIGPNTAGLLAARGYAIDSSMRSRYDYAADGGPNFSRIGNQAFWLRDGLIELPLTTVFTGASRFAGATLYGPLGRVPRARGALSRAKLLSRVALTPEDMPLAEALEAIRIALGQGVRLLNLAFHSPSLVPGNTPYVRDAADLAAFWKWWDGVLNLLAQRNVRSASVAQILAALARSGSAP